MKNYKSILIGLFFLFSFNRAYSQIAFDISITNNTSNNITVDVIGSPGVVLLSVVVNAFSSYTANCLSGQPLNLEFRDVNTCFYQIPVNQPSIIPGGTCLFNTSTFYSSQNTIPVPLSCNGGFGVLYNQIITIN